MKYTKFDKAVSWIVWAAFIGFIALAVTNDANANTQNNEAGDNTLIGTMTTTTNNDYSGAASVDNSTNSNSTSNIRSSVSPSSSPSLTSGMDSCSLSVSAGVSTFNFGLSAGQAYSDPICQAIKKARALKDLGMSVAAISVLCNSDETGIIFESMLDSATPCPVMIDGKSLIGAEAIAIYKKYPKLRLDYDRWVKRQAIIQEYKDNEVQHSTGK